VLRIEEICALRSLPRSQVRGSRLQEMQATLAERVKTWTEEWKQQGLQQGLQQGRQEGRQAGRQEGEAKVLQRLLSRRFGALPA